MTAAVLRADCGLLCPPLCLSSPAVQTEGGEESNLLRFLAVGRLVSLADGRWAEGKHQLLCFYAPKDDRDVKAYRSHIRAIMNRGAAKLQPGKRIRLTSDNNDYDLHVLADNAAAADGQTDDGDGSGSAPTTLVFFAVTDPSFAKHHTVSSLLRDFKRLFYESVQLRDVLSSSGGVGSSASSSLQRQCQPLLLRLFSTYNASRLREVQAKVEKVKSVMKDNVDKGQSRLLALRPSLPPRLLLTPAAPRCLCACASQRSTTSNTWRSWRSAHTAQQPSGRRACWLTSAAACAGCALCGVRARASSSRSTPVSSARAATSCATCSAAATTRSTCCWPCWSQPSSPTSSTPSTTRCTAEPCPTVTARTRTVRSL